MPNKLEKLKAIIELMQNDTITPKQVKEFLDVVILNILNAKKDIQNLSNEHAELIKEALEYIESKKDDTISEIESNKKSIIEEFKSNLKEANNFLIEVKKIKAIKGKNGKNGINGIGKDGKDGLNGKDGSPDTPEQIRNKLETLNGENRLDASAIKNLPEFIKDDKRIGFGSMIREAPKDDKYYARRNREWEEVQTGGGTWGSITGTLSNQTDLQSALNAKANDADVVKLTGNQTVAGEKTFTGTTRVDGGSSVARFRITATNATDPKILSWATNDVARWAMRVDGSGDHFYLRRYDDSGTLVATPLEVRRDTGDIVLNELTASRVLTTDANKHVKSSTVTTTELDYLSGVTSTVQGQYVVTTVTSTTSSPANTKDHAILLCDAATAGGNITVNLPTAVSNTAMFTIKKTDSGTNTIIIDPSSTQTIDGNTTFTLFTQYDSITLISNGSNWFII